MQFFHSIEEAIHQTAITPRMIMRKNGFPQEVYIENRIWEAHDFITGRKYGRAYISDERLIYWVERNMEDDRYLSFEQSFQGMVAWIYHRLTAVNLYQA